MQPASIFRRRMQQDDVISTALIVGPVNGLSAALAHKRARAEVKVALAARNPDKLADVSFEPPCTMLPAG